MHGDQSLSQINLAPHGEVVAYWSGRPTEDWRFSAAYTAGGEWNDTAWHTGAKADRFNELVVQAHCHLVPILDCADPLSSIHHPIGDLYVSYRSPGRRVYRREFEGYSEFNSMKIGFQKSNSIVMQKPAARLVYR